MKIVLSALAVFNIIYMATMLLSFVAFCVLLVYSIVGG